MSELLQHIIVIAAVCAAATWLARESWRTWKGTAKAKGCGCGSACVKLRLPASKNQKP